MTIIPGSEAYEEHSAFRIFSVKATQPVPTATVFASPLGAPPFDHRLVDGRPEGIELGGEPHGEAAHSGRFHHEAQHAYGNEAEWWAVEVGADPTDLARAFYAAYLAGEDGHDVLRRFTTHRETAQ